VPTLFDIDEKFIARARKHPDGAVIGFYEEICREAFHTSLENIANLYTTHIHVSHDVLVLFGNLMCEAVGYSEGTVMVMELAEWYCPLMVDNLTGMQVLVEESAIEEKTNKFQLPWAARNGTKDFCRARSDSSDPILGLTVQELVMVQAALLRLMETTDIPNKNYWMFYNRYGLDYGLPCTFKGIGKVWGVSATTALRACTRVFNAMRGEEAALPELKPALDKLATGIKQVGKIRREFKQYMEQD